MNDIIRTVSSFMILVCVIAFIWNVAKLAIPDSQISPERLVELQKQCIKSGRVPMVNHWKTWVKCSPKLPEEYLK